MEPSDRGPRPWFNILSLRVQTHIHIHTYIHTHGENYKEEHKVEKLMNSVVDVFKVFSDWKTQNV